MLYLTAKSLINKKKQLWEVIGGIWFNNKVASIYPSGKLTRNTHNTLPSVYIVKYQRSKQMRKGIVVLPSVHCYLGEVVKRPTQKSDSHVFMGAFVPKRTCNGQFSIVRSKWKLKGLCNPYNWPGCH